MAKSGLVVVVPEAEERIGHLRKRFDPQALLGVPAHITVLFPFIAPEQIDAAVLERLKSVFANVKPFSFALSQVSRFPGTAYLAPEPVQPFVALTNAVAQAFPAYPPYGGIYTSVIPHLTVSDGEPDAADVAERELKRLLQTHGAITSTCTSVALLEDSLGKWREIHAFQLRAGPG
jgi:2'-5' RNA ligase